MDALDAILQNHWDDPERSNVFLVFYTKQIRAEVSNAVKNILKDKEFAPKKFRDNQYANAQDDFQLQAESAAQNRLARKAAEPRGARAIQTEEGQENGNRAAAKREAKRTGKTAAQVVQEKAKSQRRMKIIQKNANGPKRNLSIVPLVVRQ